MSQVKYDSIESQRLVGASPRQTEEHKEPPTFKSGLMEMLFNSYLNALLIFVPVSAYSFNSGWSSEITFFTALLGLAPLAERLGFVTEQLAIHTNDTIGGLLNATFGNATEMMVAVSALFKGLYGLVQLSLLGSVLSNLLLVLGGSMFIGGLTRRTQYFKKISSQVNSTLLMISTMGILFPSLLAQSTDETVSNQVLFSRISSVTLLIMYFAYLIFQVRRALHFALIFYSHRMPTPNSSSLIGTTIAKRFKGSMSLPQRRRPRIICFLPETIQTIPG
jgi:Ca2+/H+ antiporter